MVYVFLADGFEEIEAIAPIDIMRRAGICVKTVGVTGKTVTGAHEIEISSDISLNEVSLDKASLLFLPGGMPGTTNLLENEKVKELIISANEKGIYISAICAAPMILGKLGLLKGKNATCFPGFEEYLEGANAKNDKVVFDGNIITSRGAGTAHLLGFKFVEILKEKQMADELSSAMQY